MAKEAELKPAELKPAEGGGVVPDGDGWFVLNARDAQWWHHATFGSSVIFEGEAARFPQYGVNIQVLEPGQPNCMYHGENAQESFLVLSGECRVPAARQRRGAASRAVGLRALTGVDRARVRRRRRRTVRDPDGRRAAGGRRAALPGRRRRAQAQRGCRAGDVAGERGVRAVRAAGRRAVPRRNAARLRLGRGRATTRATPARRPPPS